MPGFPWRSDSAIYVLGTIWWQNFSPRHNLPLRGRHHHLARSNFSLKAIWWRGAGTCRNWRLSNRAHLLVRSHNDVLTQIDIRYQKVDWICNVGLNTTYTPCCVNNDIGTKLIYKSSCRARVGQI